MQMKNKQKKAFTLIELLIVIAIIGILFIVLVSKVDFATDKAKATGVQTDFRSFQVAFEQVARENSGFNTFGWDEGDKSDDTLWAGKKTPDGQDYKYDNLTKDRGDKIRNSYDAGDANLDGVLDSNETWTGRKIYTETWTGIYTLVNPCVTGDDHFADNAVVDLENAINKNLDPKLHITIADPIDGETDPNYVQNQGFDMGDKVYHITMKNQAVDPWKTEYVGKYLTNASENSSTNSLVKAPADPTPLEDSLDRGAIIIYSKGANLELGSHEEIVEGEVKVTVSLKDTEAVDHNTAGQDDYSLSTIYTYKNGYGEVISSTTGFSNNQSAGANTSLAAAPSMLDGANNIVTLSDAPSFRSSAPIDEFKEVKVDGVVVASTNYTVTEGSTIITFKPEFLATLSAGDHTIDIVSKSGTASCGFKKIDGYSFTVNGQKYYFDKNMSWDQFINSDYNTNDYFINTQVDGGSVGTSDGQYLWAEGGSMPVKFTEDVSHNANYYLSQYRD